MDFKSANELLQGRNKQSRKLDNNTYLQRRDNDSIAVLLHDTDIVTYLKNGNTVLNTGSWYTPTTKDRINSNLPHGFTLYQENNIWYLINHLNSNDRWSKENPIYRFKEGITITKNGTVKNYSKQDVKKDVKIKKMLRNYANLCSEAVPIDKPSSADCWYCAMYTVDKGIPLGDAFKDVEHLKSHIKEKYIVPSLIANALKQYYNAPMAFWQTFKDTNWTGNRDFGKHAVKRAVYRYLLQRFNYATNLINFK